MRSYSSGDDSDEHDTPNIVSFQKNARRNAELIRQFVPHMNPEHAESLPPMLMKDPYTMHEDLVRSGFFSSHRSSELPATHAGVSEGQAETQVTSSAETGASNVPPTVVSSGEVASAEVVNPTGQEAVSQEVVPPWEAGVQDAGPRDPVLLGLDASEEEPSPGVLV